MQMDTQPRLFSLNLATNLVKFHLKTDLVWFGLVSLFNGISTLCRLFNAKAILLKRTVVIYKALCFDVAQGRMNGAPTETRTHSCRFASLAC